MKKTGKKFRKNYVPLAGIEPVNLTIRPTYAVRAKAEYHSANRGNYRQINYFFHTSIRS